MIYQEGQQLASCDGCGTYIPLGYACPRCTVIEQHRHKYDPLYNEPASVVPNPPHILTLPGIWVRLLLWYCGYKLVWREDHAASRRCVGQFGCRQLGPNRPLRRDNGDIVWTDNSPHVWAWEPYTHSRRRDCESMHKETFSYTPIYPQYVHRDYLIPPITKIDRLVESIKNLP